MRRLLWAMGTLLLVGCECGEPDLIPELDAGPAGLDAAMDAAAAEDGGTDAAIPDGGPLNPDAACASSVVEAQVERLPVDIVWMVDNSTSMQPAIEQVQVGLNDFTALIGARDLDYRVIMLSIRGEGVVNLGHGDRYAVCIPPPLSGDTSCGDGPRFFQVSVDIRSTQPLEQFLGTLGQTDGYLATDDRGSAPWAHLLRPEATKTIVVVTDDNARMVERSGSGFVAGSSGDPVATADWFETTADTSDGSNPFNSRTLPEGILHPRWGGLFDGYTFSGIYGWGSESFPDVRCTYGDGSNPPSSGPTYTELVTRTGGVREKICEGAAVWGPFFGEIASAVERTSRIDCAIPIPDPPEGEFFQRDRINVFLNDGSGATRVGKVPAAGDCDERGGWHYDDEADPSQVVLCPATCDRVQPTADTPRTVEIQFGCQTLPI